MFGRKEMKTIRIKEEKDGSKRAQLNRLLLEFDGLKNPAKAMILSGFFKTGPGQYGEGDIFLGLTVPQQRILAKKYETLDFPEIEFLLQSKVHEHRLTGLIILTYKYERIEKIKDKKEKIGDRKEKINDKKESELAKKQIFDFYLANSKRINNWDLVDVTAPRIVGNYLLDKPKERVILYKLASSKDLWEKRISIVSTYAFIRNNDFADTLKISEILLGDKNDLIHKAVGWMLREVGKKNEKVLKQFLNKHTKSMPRTALRYSIERLSAEDKAHYMKIS
jgi:3-methyladenine DNA glycosylase AlkD